MTNSGQQTERLYQKYDINKMTSYEQIKHIDAQYGDRVVSIDEHRNAMGYLLGFDIVLTANPPE